MQDYRLMVELYLVPSLECPASEANKKTIGRLTV